VNKDLYNSPKGEIEFPKDKREHMKKCFHMVKGADENTEGFNRNKELQTQKFIDYKQLKRIKNFFDNFKNTSSPEFHLLGGPGFKGWVNQTLDSDRGAIDLSKKAKSITSLDNQYLDSHEKNSDLKKHFRPSYSHKKSGHKITGIEEQIERINDLIKKII